MQQTLIRGRSKTWGIRDRLARTLPRQPDIADVAKNMRRRLPAHPAARTGLGLMLVAGGTFSFLPILGLWMLPAGLVVLSVDFPRIRRFRRVMEVRFMRRIAGTRGDVARTDAAVDVSRSAVGT